MHALLANRLIRAKRCEASLHLLCVTLSFVLLFDIIGAKAKFEFTFNLGYLSRERFLEKANRHFSRTLISSAGVLASFIKINSDDGYADGHAMIRKIYTTQPF